MKKTCYQLFRTFYLYIYDLKSTAALYFMACTCLYLLFGKMSSGLDVSLDFWTALQMLIVCAITGFTQKAIVPVEKISLSRSALWISLSSVVLISSLLLFQWFEAFSAWCPIVFCIFMCIGFAFLCIGIAWRSARENRKLNDHLAEYQKTLH